MEQLLKERLEILKGAEQIGEDIKNAVIDFAEDFEKKYSLTMTEENAAMLITHLAMALARIKKGEKVDEPNEFVLNEVKQTEIYDELPEFYEKIEGKLNLSIPDSEKGFIAIHVCTLMSKF
ncbi:PRD domain-containing protein [Clostridium sediminicola]|uniref:PRD domain-containing protein n=1 Tax=Clostridium sediminicola TaxID=3114879 RepID=UPI0031F1F648